MLSNKIVLPLLGVLGIIDAYLISKPNLIGKFGVWFYKYFMFKDFGTALITVFVTLGICLAVDHFLQKSTTITSTWLLAGLLLVTILLFVAVYSKFNSGSYAITGQKFKLGMQLLPVLCFLIFANTLAGKIINK